MSHYSATDVFSSFLARSGYFDVKDLLMFSRWGQHCKNDGFLDVHARTIRRWIIANDVPLVALRALQYRAGDLTEINGRHWERWRIVGDVLYSPDGIAFAQHDIKELYKMKAALCKAERELAETRAAMVALKATEQARIDAAIDTAKNIVRFSNES